MKCPDLVILSHYQDGGLDAESARLVQEHLATCRSCEKRFRKLGNLGLFLHIGLTPEKKTPCLSPEEIGTYVAGGLGAEHRERIEAHLADCRRCLHEVAIFGDAEFMQLEETSPAPTREALAAFAELKPRARRSTRGRRVAIYATSAALAAAAAVVLALALPMWFAISPVSTGSKANALVETAGALGDGTVVLASFPGEDADHASLARFARQMKLVLQQAQDAVGSPTEDRAEMLREDVLNSGLLNSVQELGDEGRDPRTQRFLTDCKTVLLEIAQLNKNNASSELFALANVIQRMNLTEMARLIELEGGGSLWLTASL